jgi:hypothetical protein
MDKMNIRDYPLSHTILILLTKVMDKMNIKDYPLSHTILILLRKDMDKMNIRDYHLDKVKEQHIYYYFTF